MTKLFPTTSCKLNIDMQISTVIIAAAIAVAHASDWSEYMIGHMSLEEQEVPDVIELSRRCIEKNEVDVMVFKEFEKRVYKDDRNVKCFFRCVAEGLEAIHSKHHINVEALAGKLSNAQMGIAQKCLSIRREDMCDQIYEAHKCYMFENDKLKSPLV